MKTTALEAKRETWDCDNNMRRMMYDVVCKAISAWWSDQTPDLLTTESYPVYDIYTSVGRATIGSRMRDYRMG